VREPRTYTEEEVARLQTAEAVNVLRGLVRVLEEVKAQQSAEPAHVRTMRKQGVVEGLSIAIAAVKRRLR
jgi:hypothetical protein